MFAPPIGGANKGYLFTKIMFFCFCYNKSKIYIMSTIDIVALSNNNHIQKLSYDYNTIFLSKIKSHFSEPQQKIFISSFYLWLNYHPINDFVIDLDNIWKWLGFKQKVNAKTLLEKNFVINNDYINKVENSNKKKHGGHNKETILLNIKTFKPLKN
jgi:hypothetical protein